MKANVGNKRVINMELGLERETTVYSFKQMVFLITLVIVYAFSNVKILSVAIQFIFVGIMFLHILKTSKIRLSSHFYWMTAFIVWSTFISLFAIDSILSITIVVNLALKLLLYTSIIIYVDSEYKFKKSLQYIVIAALVLVIRLVMVTPFSAWGTERLGQPIDLNPNTIGLVLGYASVITIFLIKRRNSKILYFLLILFVLIAMMTGSRKSFLLIILGISSVIMLENKKKKTLVLNLILIALLSIGLYYVVMNSPLLYNVIGQRLEGLGLFSNEMNASTSTRMTMIKEGLNFIKERPFLGYGLENYRVLSKYGTYSHNNYIEIAVTSGVIGLLIYYSLPIFLLLSSFKKNLKNKNYAIITVLVGMVLIMDFGMVSYSQIITQVILAICVSYYTILARKQSAKLPYIKH